MALALLILPSLLQLLLELTLFRPMNYINYSLFMKVDIHTNRGVILLLSSLLFISVPIQIKAIVAAALFIMGIPAMVMGAATPINKVVVLLLLPILLNSNTTCISRFVKSATSLAISPYSVDIDSTTLISSIRQTPSL